MPHNVCGALFVNQAVISKPNCLLSGSFNPEIPCSRLCLIETSAVVFWESKRKRNGPDAGLRFHFRSDIPQGSLRLGAHCWRWRSRWRQSLQMWGTVTRQSWQLLALYAWSLKFTKSAFHWALSSKWRFCQNVPFCLMRRSVHKPVSVAGPFDEA